MTSERRKSAAEPQHMCVCLGCSRRLCCQAFACTWPQGIWYCTAARVLYEGRPAWDSNHPEPDMAPEMYIPVVFVMWMNITALALLTGARMGLDVCHH
jgi:hypothetical protein